MNYYPVKIPVFTWREARVCRLLCRPDALVGFASDILNLGQIYLRVGSVETREGETASFLITIEVPDELRERFEEIVEQYRTSQ